MAEKVVNFLNEKIASYQGKLSGWISSALKPLTSQSDLANEILGSMGESLTKPLSDAITNVVNGLQSTLASSIAALKEGSTNLNDLKD